MALRSGSCAPTDDCGRRPDFRDRRTGAPITDRLVRESSTDLLVAGRRRCASLAAETQAARGRRLKKTS